jgi:hypothetical protein
MKPIIYSYIIILTIELFYIHFYLNHWADFKKHQVDHLIKVNLQHKEELNKKFSDVVNERIKMLDNMDYFDWIEYNIKNKYITVNNKKYHIDIWERNNINEYSHSDNSNYTVRCSAHPEFTDLSFKNVINLVNYNFLYGVYKPTEEIPNNLWGLSGLYGHHPSKANIFWLSQDGKFPIEKTVIFDKYKKLNEVHGADYGKIEFQGVFVIGYEIRNLDLDYGQVYYQFLGWKFFVLMNVIFFILTLILYYSSNEIDIYKPILFLLVTNFYLMHFLSYQAGLTNLKTEENRLVDINTGILAISFLVAVNIFIVQTLSGDKTAKRWFLHTESAILFCVSVVLLLISSIKKSSFFTIEDLRVHNILIQFFFNLSIIINLIVFLNYFIYIISLSKYFKSLKILR